jgi:hypothetical protein
MDETELQAGYLEMSRDYVCEAEALEWCEALVSDVPFDEYDS